MRFIGSHTARLFIFAYLLILPLSATSPASNRGAETVYNLTVSKGGTGSGRVTSSPPGIDCGALCSAGFSDNTTVTLTPTPDPGSFFAGWSGGDCFGTLPCNLNLSGNETVTAIFNTAQGLHVLSTNPANNDTGVATNSSIRINFSDDIQQGSNYGDIAVHETGGDPVPFAAYLYPDLGILYLDPSVRLEEDTSYTVHLPAGALLDSMGDPLPEAYDFSFTTIEPGDAQLFISGHPIQLMEGDRTRVTVWYDRTVPRDRFINLSASQASQVEFPSQIIVPAGEIGFEFEVEATRNYVADGNRTVTLSAQALGGQQASLDILIKDDDPILGNALRIAATGVIAEDNGNGIFEADEVADFLVEVYNSSGTFQVNMAVEVDIVNTFNMRTLGSGTCNIGGLGSGQIEGCDVSLLADDQLPTGAYWLKITLTSNTDTTIDYARVNVVNNSLPDFQVSSPSASTYIVEPGQTFNKRFTAVHRGDGFSPDLPVLNVLLEENGVSETLLQTYMEVRGDFYDEWDIEYQITAPSVPGTYLLWGEINPPGPDRIAETNHDNNATAVLTLIVRDENAAPILDFIGDKAVNAGSLLTFAVAAVDPNPGDTISYSLNNAPTGASIDPATGVFNWIPGESQGPADHMPTIVASDNGDPMLSDSETITIRVNKLADLGVSLSDNLSEAVPGQNLTYTIQVTNAGPNAVTGLSVTDLFPPELEDTSWSCNPSAGSACGPGGPGDLVDSADLLAGGMLTYTVTARIRDNAMGSMANTCSVGVPAGVVDPIGANNSATDIDSLRQLDFGDAPDPGLGPPWAYPTLLADNGARHGIVPGFSLGSLPDGETEGQPHFEALGDGGDEDGVTFPEPLVTCQSADIEVTVSASGFLDAWIDFNRDGDWDDPGEQVLTSEPVATGTRTFSVTVPCDAVPTAVSFARFRLSSAGGLAFDGLAMDGEVEDYQIQIQPNCTAPVVATQPDGVSGCVGDAVSFTVSVSGSAPFGYQWHKDGASLAGANGATLTFASLTPADAGSYTCVITNPCGSVTSQAAVLTVREAPGVQVHPVDHEVCPGDAVTFSVTAVGSEPLQYQWRKDGVDLPGENSPLLAIPSASAEGSYTCLVSNGCGTVVSNAGNLALKEPVATPASPVAATVCLGQGLTLEAEAQGTPPFSFQWRRDGAAIPGETGSSLVIAAVDSGDADSLDCLVTNDCGSEIVSFQVDIKEPVSITQHPQDAVVCPDEPLSLTVSATGASPLQFQWEKDGVAIAGEVAATLDITAVTPQDAGSYRCVVTNECGTVTSQAGLVTAREPVTVIDEPVHVWACPGEAVAFSLTVTGTAPFSYQWRFNGSPIAGADGPSFAIASAASGNAGAYDCIVTNACGSQTSATAALTIEEPVAILSHPNDVVTCPGDSVDLNVTVAGTAPISYQWRKDGVPIPGAEEAVYQVPVADATDTGSYDCRVGNDCGWELSNPAILTVAEPLSVTIWPSSIAQGLEPVWLNVSIGCHLADLEWEWRDLSSGETFGLNQEWVVIDPMLTETTVFEVTATDGQGTNAARATVLVPENPVYSDYNGDGCNSVEDLYLLLQDWLAVILNADDPNGDGFIDILDALYINTLETGSCPP